MLQPPIVILNVVVEEAEGLEAKDANGYSDPYCMLGIRPTHPTNTVTHAIQVRPSPSPSALQTLILLLTSDYCKQELYCIGVCPHTFLSYFIIIIIITVPIRRINRSDRQIIFLGF